MAPLKAIALWYPPQRQASLAGWIMVAGGMGALAATTPLEFALRFASWRTDLRGARRAHRGRAVWIWFRVPDVPKPAAAPSFGTQWQGVRRVFAHPRFWWIAPLAGFGMGSFMAVQGLWAVPWMLDVAGLTRAGAATHLLAMGRGDARAYLLLGACSPTPSSTGRRHPRPPPVRVGPSR